MKKIMAIFIAVALIASFGVGVIAGAGEDAFANAVIDEQTQFAYEKAAVEFAQGNDVEGVAAEEDAANNFGKTQLGFNILGGAVISAGWCPYYGGAFVGPVGRINVYRMHKGGPMGCATCFVGVGLP